MRAFHKSAIPNDLLKLHEACTDGGTDLAIGSRYISGVNIKFINKL